MVSLWILPAIILSPMKTNSLSDTLTAEQTSNHMFVLLYLLIMYKVYVCLSLCLAERISVIL